MKLKESQLRQIIREELGNPAVAGEITAKGESDRWYQRLQSAKLLVDYAQQAVFAVKHRDEDELGAALSHLEHETNAMMSNTER